MLNNEKLLVQLLLFVKQKHVLFIYILFINLLKVFRMKVTNRITFQMKHVSILNPRGID